MFLSINLLIVIKDQTTFFTMISISFQPSKDIEAKPEEKHMSDGEVGFEY